MPDVKQNLNREHGNSCDMKQNLADQTCDLLK